jgi:hypothetical protein
LARSDKSHWEALHDHLARVADGDGAMLSGASRFADAFGAGEWGQLLGLWHDLGRLPHLPKLRLDGNGARAAFSLAFWTRMLNRRQLHFPSCCLSPKCYPVVTAYAM